MNNGKTIHWLITVIGVLTFVFSIYQFMIDRPFQSYFFGGLSGIMLAIFGVSNLLKKNR